jgi:hypothetical protein
MRAAITESGSSNETGTYGSFKIIGDPPDSLAEGDGPRFRGFSSGRDFDVSIEAEGRISGELTQSQISQLIKYLRLLARQLSGRSY